MALSDIKYQEDIYSKQVQYELINAINAGRATDALQTAIEIHQKRQNIMNGLNNRRKLKSASTDKWKDPRDADGVPIFARVAPSSSKENHKLHTPFDRVIAMQKAAYMVGISPEVVIEDNDDQAKDINHLLRFQGFDYGISEVAQKAAGSGAGFMLLSTPKGKNEVHITYPNEWGCFIIYSLETGAPLYGVRYWVEMDNRDTNNPDSDESRIIEGEMYGFKTVRSFRGYWGSLTLGEEEQHMFEGVPLIEFPNNSERLGDVELTTSLQDAFDIADSDISSEISQLRLSYLSIAGDEIDINEDWLNTLKRTGVFIGDGKFIEKNLNSTAVENLKQDLEARIYKYSNSYNPDELGADKALTAFQIQQKLLRLESSSKETEMLFKASLTYMVKLITTFKSVSIDEFGLSWKFTRNTPRNAMEDIKTSVESGFRLSQKMIARLLPYEIDQGQNQIELDEESVANIGEFDIEYEPMQEEDE